MFEHECDDNTIKKTLELACEKGADLQGAYLQGAKDADIAIAMTRILPEGDIIGYKQCRDKRIVKLLIPKDAKRSHDFGRKCRAEYAEVLEIKNNTGNKCETAESNYDSDFVYKVGEIVRPKFGFSEDWTSECESGIHFYITELEAKNN